MGCAKSLAGHTCLHRDSAAMVLENRYLRLGRAHVLCNIVIIHRQGRASPAGYIPPPLSLWYRSISLSDDFSGSLPMSSATLKPEFIELECGSHTFCQPPNYKQFTPDNSAPPSPGTDVTLTGPFPEVIAPSATASTVTISQRNESSLPPADGGMQAWCFVSRP